MSNAMSCLVVILIILSFFFMWAGWHIRNGKRKSWWLIRSTPIVPTLFAIVLLPFGFWLLGFALSLIFMNSMSVDMRVNILLYIIAPSFTIIILLPFFTPKWLLPTWYFWLEKNHSDIIELLQREARKMGGRAWEKRIQTQEGLEAWVAEVRAKHNR